MKNALRILAACLLLVLPGSGEVMVPQAGPDRPQIDVESYRIEATIVPDRGELLAIAEVRFARLDRTSYVTFDLDPRLRVRDVFLVGEVPVPARFRQFDSDSTLEVDLRELGSFDDPVIRVEYEGVLEARPDEFAPILADIGPNGAFFLEEAKWFPVNGVRSDPAAMHLDLVMPEGWRIVSNLSVGAPEAAAGTVRPSANAPAPGSTATDLLNPNIPGVGGGPVEARPAPDTRVAVPAPEAREVPEAVDPEAEDREQDDDPAFSRPELIRPPSRGERADPEEEAVRDLADLGFEAAEELGFETVRVTLVGTTPSHWGTLAVGPYETVVKAVTGGGEVEVFTTEGSPEAADAIGEGAGTYFGFYRDMFGAPSSDAFRVVEIPGANWDAQSAPGMLWLASDEFREDFDPWVLSQHVATQWFPLTYGVEDPAADAWLAEGLAVFASMFYFEETLPAADALEHIERTLVKALSYEGDVPVANAAALPAGSAEYRALAAYKGGFIFRMLRDVMGAELFRAMLDEFPETFGAQGLSTERVRDVASDFAGRDLFFFFDQWLTDPGIPEFTSFYTIYRRSAGGYEVEGQINQDLDLFQMPVEVEVETDGEPEYHQVWVSGPFSDLDLVTERKPRTVSVDPNMRLLRMSPDMRIKVHIARGEDLADAGRLNDALEEYQAAIDLDRLSSHALFRMGEALFELGNLGLAATVFRDAINGDLDPTWIEVWSYVNLGKIFDARQQRERAITEYQKAVNTGDDAYGAQAEAERYLQEPFSPRG